MTESRWRKRGYGSSNWSNPLHDAIMENHRTDLEKWQRDQPISILQLDPSDRIVLKVADERDAIQKKTFTKWANKHLKKVSQPVSGC